MQGILFKPWKQKAIRESPLDKLWQTRRLGHLKEINKEPDMWDEPLVDTSGHSWLFLPKEHTGGIRVKPRYKIEETVYIKEAWATENRYNHLKPSLIPRTAKIWYLGDIQNDPFQIGIKRSPMFMPNG